MSRRLQTSHSRLGPEGQDLTIGPTANNVYLPKPYPHHYHKPRHHNGGGCQTTTIDTGLSDDTYTDSQSYYDDYYKNGGVGGVGGERSFSDDSGSTRIPIGLYDMDEDNDDGSSFNRRLSRNTYSSERSRRNYHHHHQQQRSDIVNVHKDVRRVYPMGHQFVGHPQIDRVYQEIPTQVICEQVPAQNSNNPNSSIPRRLPTSRMSDRPQSSMSSGMTSTIVDGCGGKCQTFENVCYFFLQMVFMMGILIGISLCIAGLVLRKSAARNLQVLVYIGILLAIVSGVLLGIQWNARSIAKKRKLAVRTAKRGPILLETFNPRVQQPLMAVQDGNRVVPQIVRQLPREQAPIDHQGIPWWRRKDLT